MRYDIYKQYIIEIRPGEDRSVARRGISYGRSPKDAIRFWKDKNSWSASQKFKAFPVERH